MTRGEKACGLRHEGVPIKWRHKLAAKPAGAPDISALTTDEQNTILRYAKNFDDFLPADTPSVCDNTNVAFSAAANTKMADYLAYLTGPAYLAWRDQNLIRREAQYRVTMVDAIEEVISSGTVAPSNDSAGAGANAPAGNIPASA